MGLVYDNVELQIPRGIVFFDQFDDNGATQGEDDMGNCPGVTLTIATEKADHFSSRTGIREKDQSVVVQIDRTGVLICDHMSVKNSARWYSADVESVSQNNTAVTDEVITVTPGKFYQLGKTSSNPAGNRNVSTVVVTDSAGTTTYTEGDDYEIDLVAGRLQILESGDIPAGDIKVDYAKAAKTWNRVKTGAASELEGALRIISDHASGTNRDHYMPHVKLKPRGDLPVITEDTQYVRMEFDLEILTPENGSAIYLDDQPVA
jgi:hypothetical protein